MAYPFDSTPYSHEMFNQGQFDLKYEMFRFQNQMHQTQSEVAPSLLSSASAPSIPSASSSTIGSPSSSHAIPVSSPAGVYMNEYMVGPTIVDDSFAYAYGSAHFDHEAAFGQEAKFGVPCVGKSADLSSSARSTISVGQESSHKISYVSSPELAPSSIGISSPPFKRHQFSSEVPTSTSTGVDTVFKSPTIPASFTRKNTLPPLTKSNASRVASFGKLQNSFRHSYTFPLSTQSSTQQCGSDFSNLSPSTSVGSAVPMIEAQCSSPTCLFQTSDLIALS